MTDDHAESRRVEFHELIKEKQAEKAEKERKRKCQAAHMDEQEDAEVQIIERKKRRHKKNKKPKQPKLEAFVKPNDALAADLLAVAKWVFAHNIPPNTMQGPYWKRMNAKLQNVTTSYTPMYSKKIFVEMLSLLREQAETELNAHLKHRKEGHGPIR